MPLRWPRLKLDQQLFIPALMCPSYDNGEFLMSPTIQETQQRVDDWINSIGVRYFSELTNLAQLVEEVGELARVMSRKFGEQSCKNGETAGQIDDELADILFVLICLANQTGVDLSEAFERNMAKKTERDANRHLENPKLES